jgi:hypothetical protein
MSKYLCKKKTFYPQQIVPIEVEQVHSTNTCKNFVYVQWVDRYFWLLVLDSRDSKNKLEVTRLGQVVQNRFQKMNMTKQKQKTKFQNL